MRSAFSREKSLGNSVRSGASCSFLYTYTCVCVAFLSSNALDVLEVYIDIVKVREGFPDALL